MIRQYIGMALCVFLFFAAIGARRYIYAKRYERMDAAKNAVKAASIAQRLETEKACEAVNQASMQSGRRRL